MPTEEQWAAAKKSAEELHKQLCAYTERNAEYDRRAIESIDRYVSMVPYYCISPGLFKRRDAAVERLAKWEARRAPEEE